MFTTLLTLLLACTQSVKIGEGEDALTVTGPPAIDPWRSGPMLFEVYANGPGNLEVSVRRDDTVRWTYSGTSENFGWNGRDSDGVPLEPGPVEVEVALVDGSQTVDRTTLTVEIVDLGLLEGKLGGDRISLIWHNNGRYASGGTDTATFVLAATHDDNGAIDVPAPYDDLDMPAPAPLGVNLPAAYAWDARPTLALTLGPDVGEADLAVSIDGWTRTTGRPGPGATLVFEKDTALAAGPSVQEPTLVLRFTGQQAGQDGEVVVAEVPVPLRLYALLGPPTFESSELPYGPWVAAIDPMLRTIGGVTPDREAVTSAIVDYIYEDLGLSYDTRSGASAYTTYRRYPFDRASVDLTGFLRRSRGSVVNCTDCAALVEAHANMVGAETWYTIIDPPFDLNQIKAIGGDEFDNCPFGRGGCGFSYHAVATGSLDADVIYDATLRLDGDDDPGELPSTELPVHALYADVYLERLVMSGRPIYHYTQAGSIQ